MSYISESHWKLAYNYSFCHPISFYSRKEIPCWSAGSVHSPRCPPEPRALGQLCEGVTEHLRTLDQSHMQSSKLENLPNGQAELLSQVIHSWRSSVHSTKTVNFQCQEDLEVQGKHFWPPSSLHLWHFAHIHTTITDYCQLPEGDLRKKWEKHSKAEKTLRQQPRGKPCFPGLRFILQHTSKVIYYLSNPCVRISF